MYLCEVSRLDGCIWMMFFDLGAWRRDEETIDKDFNCIFNLFNLDDVIVILSLKLLAK